MKKLLRGVKKFKTDEFSDQAELYQHLAEKGQDPDTFFVTCSDSRVSPTKMTSADPGDIFVLRNPGNIIPPYGAGDDSTESTVEYAVEALQVKDVIICGHSHCGAMTGLMKPEKLEALPRTKRWLRHAERTRQVIEHHCSQMDEHDQVSAAIQQNVLAQLDNLRTHPSVAKRLSDGDLRLHAWVFHIATGEVYNYDPELGEFLQIGDIDDAPIAIHPEKTDMKPL
ncbi:MAG: carbonic anhydrase [Myxococcota bacterium]